MSLVRCILVPPPAPPAGQQLEIVCRAVDVGCNTQPESTAPLWNLRGLANNAWHRVAVTAVEEAAAQEED